MKNSRIYFIVGLAIIFLFIKASEAFAEIEQDTVIEQDDFLETLHLDELERYWIDVSDEYKDYIPNLSKTTITEMIKENKSISFEQTFKSLIKFIFHEIILNGKLLGLLMILTLFSVILQSIHSAFASGTVSRIAYFIVYIILIYIGLNSFQVVYSYTKETVDIMSSFMIALIPLLLGLMAAFGSVLSVSFFHPVIIFLIHFSGILVSTFVLPLLYLSALLIIVSQLNKNFQATHLADLFRTISLGALGIFLTIFLGVMSVQGAVSAVQDGVALKTTKFITGNFIPVVGRTFTDAADTVLSAALLLKNSVGLVGVTVIIIVAIFPSIKIFVIAFIFKLAAAVLQPLGKNPIITSLDIMSKYILYILACLLTVTIMFFLAIVIITVASNIPLLMK